MSLMTLVPLCKAWFTHRNITDVVVGFSGGIDSAVTAALISRCGVKVHLAVVEAENQNYSSPMGGFKGAKDFAKAIQLEGDIHEVHYDFMFSNDSANEAAAPIQRVAAFYAICAQLRTAGAKALVAGTANFDEAGYLGFWGKASDGAQDFYPLSHLHKSEVQALAEEMFLPTSIINAVPSGDLLFTKTNDLEMIGASYPQIEAVSKACENNISDQKLKNLFQAVSTPRRFYQQIAQNAFKYDLPFSGFHISERLETFRKNHYPRILHMAKSLEDE